MEFRKVLENEKEKYQSFVKANGYFLQDWDWGEFQKSLGRDVYRYLVENKGRTVLSAQGILSTSNKKSYLSFPYGPVFLDDLSQEDREKALDFLAAEISANSDLVFFRVEPQKNLGVVVSLKKTIDNNPHQTLVLDLSKEFEVLLKEMHTKTRYNIKVAQKHGIEVRTQTEIESGKNPFQDSAARAGFKSYDRDYYNKMLSFFQEGRNIHAKLYCAWHEKDLLATNLTLFWNGTVIYLFGGSTEHKRNFMPTYLLHWQTITEAKESGFKQYDFWGVETDPEHPWYGFSKFKLGFGGEIKTYFGTWDYVLQPAWYNIYKIFREINRKIR